jgi:transcriptional regulator with GAF, ATPase, and Fis domain
MPGEVSDHPHIPVVESNPATSDVINNEADLSEELSLREKLNICEKRIVQDALKRAKGVKKEAATILQIDPRNFAYLLRKHGLLIIMLCYLMEEYIVTL